jgi:2,5-diketo-D-gluconate reductase A
MRGNLDVFDFELADDEMAQIAEMDTGTTLFFDHRDPREVSRLGKRRVD